MRKGFFDYLFLCHKIPSRSFFYRGKQFPICSRCTGLFIGYVIGIVCLILSIFMPFLIIKFWITLILIIPTVVDGSIQYFTNYESNNLKRLMTGILSGIGVIFFLYYVSLLGLAHGRWIVESLQ